MAPERLALLRVALVAPITAMVVVALFLVARPALQTALALMVEPDLLRQLSSELVVAVGVLRLARMVLALAAVTVVMVTLPLSLACALAVAVLDHLT